MKRSAQIAKHFRGLLGAKRFRAFKVTASSGESACVHDPDQAAISPLMSEVIFDDRRQRFHQVQVNEILSLDPVPHRAPKKRRPN
jgi:hypothetical protein